MRRLLPAQSADLEPGPASPSSSSRDALPTRDFTASLRPRIAPATAACRACRIHKAKCFAERPACRRCVKRNIPCHYDTRPGETRGQALNRRHADLREQSSVHEEALQLLKSLSDQDAHDVLMQIRSGVDLSTIVNHVTAGDALKQMAVAPEVRFRYIFPYRSEMPPELLIDSPYLDSVLYEAATVYLSDEATAIAERLKTSLGSDVNPESYQSLYLMPFHAAKVVDPLLFDVDVSSWTSVYNDNMLMRDMLATFFQCEYQLTAAFHKDLFLQDMKDHRTDFCSSMLVNIILGISSICYQKLVNRAEYWNPSTLTYRFVAEAKRLWELEARTPRLTTIQAGILFSVFHNMCGMDEIGQPYRIQGVALAHQLRLFEVDASIQDAKIRTGTAFTAWAVYNWETLIAYSFMHTPLVTKVPEWPLPDPVSQAEHYGEIWLKYPLTDVLAPSLLAHVLWAKSLFRIIMNDYCQVAYSGNSGPTLEEAHAFVLRLRSWYSGLEGALSPRAIVLPQHLQLHIYFHHLVLTIFEPFSEIETNLQPYPTVLTTEARKHLETLVRLYFLRHGFEAMDLFIVIPLMIMGYGCIDVIHTIEPSGEKLESMRSTLILVAQGLSSQRKNHYLARALFQVIRGRMRPSEMTLLRNSIVLDEVLGEAEYELVQSIRSHWPVSVVKRKEDINAHILTNLVESYAGIDLEGSKATTQPSESAKSRSSFSGSST